MIERRKRFVDSVRGSQTVGVKQTDGGRGGEVAGMNMESSSVQERPVRGDFRITTNRMRTDH
jgi:hypothetical protein